MKDYNKLLPLRQLQHRLKKQQEKNYLLSLELKQARLEISIEKSRANKEQKRKLELIEINKNLSKGYKNLIEITRNEQKRKNKNAD